MTARRARAGASSESRDGAIMAATGGEAYGEEDEGDATTRREGTEEGEDGMRKVIR